MQHFVEENVLEEPKWNKRLIKSGINPDDAIFFLNRAEDEGLFRTMPSAPSPLHLVTAQFTSKIALFNSVEDALQVKIFAFVPQI